MRPRGNSREKPAAPDAQRKIPLLGSYHKQNSFSEPKAQHDGVFTRTLNLSPCCPSNSKPESKFDGISKIDADCDHLQEREGNEFESTIPDDYDMAWEQEFATLEGKKLDKRLAEWNMDQIGIGMRVWKVLELDVQKQTITVDFTLDFQWYDKLLMREHPKIKVTTKRLTMTKKHFLKMEKLLLERQQKEEDLDDMDEPESSWPEFRFINAVGKVDQDSPVSPPIAYIIPPNFKARWYTGPGHIDGELRTEATFRDPITAYRFPYDTQDYSFEIGIFPKSDRWARTGFCFNNRLFWQPLSGGRVKSNQISTDNTAVLAWDLGNTLHTQMSVRKGWEARVRWVVIAKRNPAFYETNIILPLMLFNLLALTSFMVDVEELGDRIGFNGSMIIATISLRFAYTNSLPELPYLTNLDWKMMATLITFTVTCLVQVAEAHWLKPKDEDHETINHICGFVIFALVLVQEFWFVTERYWTTRAGNRWIADETPNALKVPKQFENSKWGGREYLFGSSLT
eukprot:g2699.t1